MKEKSDLYNIAVLVSGSGSNLQSVIDNTLDGSVNGRVALVVSDREGAYALKRGENHNIPSYYLKGDPEGLIRLLDSHKIDLVVLAGYLSILPKQVVQAYENRIINIHPSLIPKYCGKGFYGMNVHNAVIAGNEKVSGATVHFVDAGIDTGPIILQETVEITEEDTPETLQQKVLKIEHEILPKGINMVLNQLTKE